MYRLITILIIIIMDKLYSMYCVTYKPCQWHLLALYRFPLKTSTLLCFLYQLQGELLDDQPIHLLSRYNISLQEFTGTQWCHTNIIDWTGINIFLLNEIFKCVQLSIICCSVDQYCSVFFLKYSTIIFYLAKEWYIHIHIRTYV